MTSIQFNGTLRVSGISWLFDGLHQGLEQVTPVSSIARKSKLVSGREVERPAVCSLQVYQCTTMITGASLQDVRTTCLRLSITFSTVHISGLRLSLFAVQERIDHLSKRRHPSTVHRSLQNNSRRIPIHRTLRMFGAAFPSSFRS